MAKQELMATTRTASRVVRNVLETARQEFISRGKLATESPVIAAEVINLTFEKKWGVMIGHGPDGYQISRII